MALPTTETLHKQAPGLDTRPSGEIARILVDGQIEAASAVTHALPAICDGAHTMAEALKNGGRLVYVGAGSSGLMAAADALELSGTFGIPTERVRIVMAGGMPTSSEMPGATEDMPAHANDGLADVAPEDAVVAVAASGSTPFTVSAARHAQARGARVVGLANNPDTPLLRTADIAVLLSTPPEVVSGSTRLGAGTAQKIALNTMSTLMAFELGHVCDGMMVNLVADNKKLRQRAISIVRAVSGASEESARNALAATRGDVKPAVLLASGASSPEMAQEKLEETNGHLRQALERLREN